MLLARDESAKRSFLSFVEHLLPGRGNASNGTSELPWSGHLMLGTSSGIYRLEPSRLIATAERNGAASRPRTAIAGRSAPRVLCMRAAEIRELTALDARSLADLLLEPGGTDVPAAIEVLRQRAAGILASEDEPGARSLAAAAGADVPSPAIADLARRIADLETRLAAARSRDAAASAAIAAAFESEADSDVVRGRLRSLAERERLETLVYLWPHWQSLAAAAAELEAIGPVSSAVAAVEAEIDAAEERRTAADHSRRAHSSRLAQLEHERDGLRVKQSLLRVAAEAGRIDEEIPAYRDHLLRLAASRARVAELESDIADTSARLGSAWDLSRLAGFEDGSPETAQLHRWRERARGAAAVRLSAREKVAALRETLHTVCDRATEELAADPAAEEDELDASWRALYRLRANLEEVWLVQSRAESSTRALHDREAALRSVESTTRWAPSAFLGRAVSLLVAAAAATAAACAVRRRLFDAALFGLAAVAMGVLRLALRGRANWVLAEMRKTRSQAQKIRAELQDLAARRDADWRRAAEVGGSIRSDAARLGLVESPTPEVLDECEQELAQRLREHGAETALGELLRSLLDLQEQEQEAIAASERAEEAETALASQWDSWRAAARLPEGVDPEGAEERLRQLRSLAATIAARDAARAEMSALEPEIAAWEAAARAVLQQVGVEVPPDLCGRALTTELAVLGKRIERNRERELRREALQADIVEARGRLETADAALEQSAWEWNELIAAAGAADEQELKAKVAQFRRRRDAERRAAESERVVAAALGGLEDAPAVRAELATGNAARWQEELERVDARLVEIGRTIDARGDRWQRAESPLAAALREVEVPDLLQEREEILAALDDAAREWRLLTVARGLIEQSVEERESARRREVLHHASRVLASLGSGAHAEITAEGKGGALWLTDRHGVRSRVDRGLGAQTLGRLYVSVRLGTAAQLASHGTPVPLILDDVLGALPPADAEVVAREIATAARGQQVLYVTTDAATRETLISAGAGAAVPVLKI